MKMMRFYFTVISVISVSLQAAGVADDWPQLQGPNHRGISEEKGLARRWPEGGPPVLWSRPVGPGFGGPSIRDGQVYLLDRIKDAKDVLRCLDLMTGEQRWQYAHEAPGRLMYNGSRSVPTVGAARVFAVGPFGHLYCIDRDTHKLLWHLDVFKEFAKEPPQFGYVQSPLIYKDSVIICPASESVGMVALDQTTGEVLWRSKPLGTKGYVSPIVHRFSGVDAVLFVTDKQVCGVNPATGDMLWHYAGYNPPQPVPFPTVIGDGRLFITAADDAGSVMIKVSLRGGNFKVCELFRLDHYGSQLHPPLYYEGFLYGKFFTRERNTLVSRLICLDLDGNIKWKMGNEPRIERGNLMIADKMIFALDGERGELFMAEAKPEGYQELGRAKVIKGKDKFVISPMALSNGRLVVRDQHDLRCLDVRMMRDER